MISLNYYNMPDNQKLPKQAEQQPANISTEDNQHSIVLKLGRNKELRVPNDKEATKQLCIIGLIFIVALLIVCLTIKEYPTNFSQIWTYLSKLFP